MTRSMLRFVVALALTVFLTSLAHAEVLELEGMVKAVDSDDRSITIERKTAKGTKTLELEVAKKAGNLGSIKVGDTISFGYDPDLEIVTKIGGGGNAQNKPPQPRSASAGQGTSISVEVGPHEVVLKAGHEGMDYFSDEPISILSHSPLSFLVVNSRETVLLEGDSFHASHRIRDLLKPAGGEAFDKDYAGITSVVWCNTRKVWLALYHAEYYVGGPITYAPVSRAYWTVGLAEISSDRQRCQRLGQVLAPQRTKESMRPEEDHLGLADAAFVASSDGEWYYAYYFPFNCRPENPKTAKHFPNEKGFLSMARSKASDGGRPGTWRKFHNNDFREPGLGGVDGVLVRPPKHFPADLHAPHVVYVSSLQKYLLASNVMAYADFKQDNAVNSGVYFSFSDNGIEWAEPRQLIRGHSIPYVGKEYISHPRFVVDPEQPQPSSNVVKGWIYYAYSENWGLRPQYTPHYLCRRPITITASKAASLSDRAVAGSSGRLTDLHVDGLSDRLKGTKWTNTNNVTFEWTNDGRLLHRGNERQWKPSGDDRVEVVFGKDHVDVIVFDESLKTFKQLIKGGPSSMNGRRVDQ